MKNISTQKERILQFIDYKGLSKNKFYIKTSISNGVLDKKSGLSMDTVEKIYSTYPEINAEWLLTGRGEMLKQKTLSNYEIPLATSTKVEEEQRLSYGNSIPLVSVKAVGGFGNSNFSIEEKDVKDHYVIPKFKHKKIDFMIEIEGSSMYPKYNSGDIVACRIINESNFIQWNKTHVIATKDQGIIVKRIRKGNTTESLTMHSDNENYEPFEVSVDDLEGVALVVGVIRLE